jgi:hypothetical protein
MQNIARERSSRDPQPPPHIYIYVHLRARISNRHFLVRLENAATDRKQTPEANSNRHFWEGGRLEVVSGGLYRCTYNARHYMMYW